MFWSPPLPAHFRDQSYLYLKLYGRTVDVRVEITIEDLNRALDVNLPAAGVTRQDINPNLDRINRYVFDNVDIKSEGKSYKLSYENYDFLKVPFGQFLLVDYSLETFGAVPKSLDIRYTPLLELDESRKNLLVIEEDWRTSTFGNEGSFSLVFTPEKPEQRLDLSNSTVWNGFFLTVRRGLKNGFRLREYGVFLFAAALAIAFQRPTASEAFGLELSRNLPSYAGRAVALLGPLVLGVGAALGVSGLDIIAVPVRLAATVSAITIGLMALEAIRPWWRERLGWLTFVAGLSFGFISAEMFVKIGLFRHYLVLSCLGLSVGFALAGMVMLLFELGVIFWARSQVFSQWVLRFSTAGLSIISSYWFIKRALNLEFQLLGFLRGVLQ
ncbi:MAG: hypothetical protein AAFY57_16625 [Cyanobacteria bacterium J06642_2]